MARFQRHGHPHRVGLSSDGDDEDEEDTVQLTPEELISEFHDAVMELYFANKRIAALEADNAALRAQLTAGQEQRSPAGAASD